MSIRYLNTKEYDKMVKDGSINRIINIGGQLAFIEKPYTIKKLFKSFSHIVPPIKDYNKVIFVCTSKSEEDVINLFKQRPNIDWLLYIREFHPIKKKKQLKGTVPTSVILDALNNMGFKFKK